MLQELAAQTHATTWSIVSLLFFAAFYVVVAVRTFRARREDLDRRARLVLEGDDRES